MTNNPSPIFVIKPKVIPSVIVTDLMFIKSSFASMIFSIVFSAFLFGFLGFWPIIFFIGPGVVYIVYVLIREYYKNSVYELYNNYLIIKTNFVVSYEVTAQYKNILDIAKYQGPIQANFNLHDITIRLAGDQHNYRLKNLENAQTIVDFINKTKNPDKA